MHPFFDEIPCYKSVLTSHIKKCVQTEIRTHEKCRTLICYHTKSDIPSHKKCENRSLHFYRKKSTPLVTGENNIQISCGGFIISNILFPFK